MQNLVDEKYCHTNIDFFPRLVSNPLRIEHKINQSVLKNINVYLTSESVI